ncbi:energy-coupled thiamine transporter ThiT [Scatolibacter rhodanostii]|uniref:energy-coupled thiamine transporter ThiT n=1 Tax=Scatolibacter rhodanostii TaxID=2014781 RepID=UPI000C082F9F|nr:energy-coupled thiamine transporter ThiT [Scatolibacter rhodanostii]
MTKSDKTFRIVLGGIMVALSVVLSFVKVFEMPYGGSITLCSMLPVAFYGYRYGAKWGVGAAFVYGVTQLLFGLSSIRALTGTAVIGSILFDYLVAFSLLGFAGVFKKTKLSPPISFACGTIFVIILRYICHIISGIMCYSEYAEWYFSQEGFTFGAWVLERFSGFSLSLLYSAVYNAMYIVPEMIITAVAAFLLLKFAGKKILNDTVKG